jgi:AraC-like DNA-binding protein
MDEFREAFSSARMAGGEEMRAPEEVETMLRLNGLGWGTKRIAAELGCSRNTVKRYLKQGAGSSTRRRTAVAFSMTRRDGWRGGFVNIAAMPTSSGRSSPRSSGLRCRCGRSSGQFRVSGAS